MLMYFFVIKPSKTKNVLTKTIIYTRPIPFLLRLEQLLFLTIVKKDFAFS